MRFTLALVLGLLTTIVWAQNITISGTVTDDVGLPIADAYVFINDSGTGAVTDQNGNFQYAFQTSGNDSIRIEAERYISQKQPIGTQRIFNIRLKPDIADLSELVMTSSYGTAKVKEEVVGAITTLQAEDIATTSAFESVDKMIEGQVAGLLFEGDSQLGTPTSINIRGAGTLTALGSNPLLGTSTQPLIFIDGVPISEDRPTNDGLFSGAGNFGETLLNPLARIPEDQIESITVLKDAAAVGFYGADAANGVILITTKKGKVGKTKYSLQFQYGASETINEINYLSGPQYAELYNEYLQNSNIGSFDFNGVDVNWFDELNKSGTFLQTNFNASGGQSKLAYRAGISYRKTDEAQVGNELERITGTLNVNSKLGNVTLGLSNTFTLLDKTSPNNFFNFILAPTFPIRDDNGDFSFTGTNGIPNPLAAIEQNIDESETLSYLGNIILNWAPIKGLKLSTQYGLDYSNKEQTTWLSGLNESGRRSGSFSLNGESFPDFGRSIFYDKQNVRWNYNASAYYERSLGRHNFDAFLGFELRYDRSDNVRNFGNGYIDFQNFRTPEEADGEFLQRFASRIQKGRSLFTQLNYNFDKKYFILGNLRRDESSAFGGDSDVAWNGGLGASWVMSKENFLNNATWLRFLRMRASWGITGNSRIGAYRALGLYSATVLNRSTGDITSTRLNTPPNPNLGWEQNEKWNLGFDLNIFKSLNFVVDFFRDNRSDLIVSRDVPLETGFQSSEINGSSMYNQGVEFTVGWNVWEKKNFKWKTSFNITTLKNEVTRLSGFGENNSISEIARAQRIGFSTTAIWGFDWVGVDPATGRDLYNVNGEIINGLELNTVTDPTDWRPIGDSNPEFFGGWSNSFTIHKDFNLTILADFKWGQDQLVQNELINQYTNLINRNISTNALNRWRSPGDLAPNPIVDNNNRPVSNGSQFIYDQTYFRIRSVNLSYNLPSNEIKWLDNAQLFLNVTNLLYWYREKSPEGANGIRELRYQYPEMRTISLGFNLNF